MELWAAVDGRSKDYIAEAKPNGYQSLHTTLRVASVTVELPQSSMDDISVSDAAAGDEVGPGPTLELQIRTAGECTAHDNIPPVRRGKYLDMRNTHDYACMPPMRRTC